jgi:predicted RNA binding protein with dsRBD fold (UPF0201 family)
MRVHFYSMSMKMKLHMNLFDTSLTFSVDKQVNSVGHLSWSYKNISMLLSMANVAIHVQYRAIPVNSSIVGHILLNITTFYLRSKIVSVKITRVCSRLTV